MFVKLLKCTFFQKIIFFPFLFFVSMVFGSEVEQLAKEGNPASQYAFAFEEMLLNPNIVSEWLIISALQGHYKAAHYLKKLPTQSNSIAEDLKSSNADSGHFLHKFGSIKILSKKDLNLIREKGNNGDSYSQFLMWELYVNDKGVSKAEAWTWLKQAAGNDHPRANFSLGILYYFGYIVPKEEKRAFTLIAKSSQLGCNLATLFLKRKLK